MIGALAFAAFLVCAPTPTCGPDVPPPCATPTPSISWDQVPDADLDGYDLNYRLTGTTDWTVLAVIPCQRWLDDDGNLVRLCRAPDLAIPIQRYPQLVPENSYDFCVKAYDTSGNRSIDCSDSITICMPPVWPGAPAEYQ